MKGFLSILSYDSWGQTTIIIELYISLIFHNRINDPLIISSKLQFKLEFIINGKEWINLQLIWKDAIVWCLSSAKKMFNCCETNRFLHRIYSDTISKCLIPVHIYSCCLRCGRKKFRRLSMPSISRVLRCLQIEMKWKNWFK